MIEISRRVNARLSMVCEKCKKIYGRGYDICPKCTSIVCGIEYCSSPACKEWHSGDGEYLCAGHCAAFQVRGWPDG